MKKLFSLVLALAMTMGLATVGAHAGLYVDDGGEVSFGDDLTVTGTLSVNDGGAIDVAGDATFAGTSTLSLYGAMDIGGDTTFDAGSKIDILDDGVMTMNGGFTNNSSKVTIDGDNAALVLNGEGVNNATITVTKGGLDVSLGSLTNSVGGKIAVDADGEVSGAENIINKGSVNVTAGGKLDTNLSEESTGTRDGAPKQTGTINYARSTENTAAYDAAKTAAAERFVKAGDTVTITFNTEMTGAKFSIAALDSSGKEKDPTVANFPVKVSDENSKQIVITIPSNFSGNALQYGAVLTIIAPTEAENGISGSTFKVSLPAAPSNTDTATLVP